jgi:DNA-binding IclR family transcriptional regulator
MDFLIKAIRVYKKLFEKFALRDPDALLNALLATPVFSITQLANDIGYTFAGINLIVRKLEQAGIVKQRGEGKRSKTYRLEEYMQILEADNDYYSPVDMAASRESVE